MPSGDHHAARKRMLAVVADDDDDARELMASALRRAGFGVHEVRDGDELVHTVNANANATVLVVSDIGMPRTDGISATRVLRTSKPELPIVLVTAFADGQTRLKAEKAGADCVLQKPLELAELVEVVLGLARRYQ